ncbi:MAG: hypothetical protein E6J88_12060 [Deltaproteobacteria bacterium]|nr:MAG: hypothetical protein E6J88_12060 [Deltaproteobacteria bacterium]
MSRRALLAGIATGAGAAAAGTALWPLAAAVVDPLLGKASKEDAPWVDVAGEKEMRADVPLKGTVRIAVRDGFFTTLVDLGAV